MLRIDVDELAAESRALARDQARRRHPRRLSGLPGGRPPPVPFHLATGLAQRPQRPGLPGGNVSPLLSTQSLWLELGQHALGPRAEPRPGALEGAADRTLPPQVRRLVLLGKCGRRLSQHERVSGRGSASPGRRVHQHRPGRVHRLQQRPGQDLEGIRGEPGRQALRARSQAALVRAGEALGHGRL